MSRPSPGTPASTSGVMSASGEPAERLSVPAPIRSSSGAICAITLYAASVAPTLKPIGLKTPPSDSIASTCFANSLACALA